MAHEDALIPIRMVNEYVYCPRLFWLETVASEWADNAHTIAGDAAHRQVDKPGGAIPAPNASGSCEEPIDEDAAPWHARALWLSDSQLGVSGRMDLVEVSGDEVIPVDTKKGRAPTEGGFWPSDDVQLTLQALLLRAQGYRVKETAVWYREVRRRVVVPLSDQRIAFALESVRQAADCASQPDPPPPLIDSPKCGGCSLSAICQPDEVNLLRGTTFIGEDQAIRRVVPARGDGVVLHVTGHGARVGLSGSCLRIQPRRDEAADQIEVGLSQLAEVNLHGSAQITTQAIQQLTRAGVPLSFFSGGGWFYGRVEAAQSRNVHVRIAQFGTAGTHVALKVARSLIGDKIANQRTLL